MTCRQALLKGNPLEWLLEADTANPSIRYLTLRDIVGLPADNSQLWARGA
ncbi:hypothetical protein Dehly_0762 [Dehalogenimonas lykanthroporepellens BL-DC-9]|jgi:hypothetical protein|nr:hypothetical protein Dehly_0762 [Dehalogenimonas lykanthroporepellens BL-DC-9]